MTAYLRWPRQFDSRSGKACSLYWTVALNNSISRCSNYQRVSHLFTRDTYHRGISVLFLGPNVFPPCKLSRTISLNSHYIFSYSDFLKIPFTGWSRFKMLSANFMVYSYFIVINSNQRTYDLEKNNSSTWNVLITLRVTYACYFQPVEANEREFYYLEMMRKCGPKLQTNTCFTA